MKWWLLMVWLAWSGIAVAEIYRWTDDYGRVHYGERPPNDRAEQLDIKNSSSPAPAQADESARRARQQRMLDAFEYERERKAEKASEDARKAGQLAVECDRIRSQWRRLSYGGPIYFQGEDGERRYLDEEQRTAEKNQLRPVYLKACGKLPD